MRLAWLLVVAGCGFQSPIASTGGSGGADGPAAPDAGFDYALCPASYNAALPGPSRYRLLIDGHVAWAHSDTCSTDLPGATHLVVFEAMPELLSVSALVNTPPLGIAGNAIWVGGVQPRTVLLPGDGWLGYDGAPLISAWDTGEPNDGGTETDHSEQFVFLERNRHYLADRPGNTNLGALCECDGKPVAANATAAITASRTAPPVDPAPPPTVSASSGEARLPPEAAVRS